MPDNENAPITDITSIETIEQIQVQLAVILAYYTELVRTYYDMFYNNTPMDIDLQLYNDEGELVTITVPNRAKATTISLTFNGSPEGVLEASQGAVVLDRVNKNLWYKADQNGTDGWYMLYSTRNWEEGIDFLAPNGSGELLTDLNASSVTSGILRVENGGTGVSEIEGIVKAVPEQIVNGETIPAHFEQAVAGTDYMDLTTLAGMIVFFPEDQVPPGYLVCNGDMYNSQTYTTLYNYLSKDGTQPCRYGEENRDGVLYFATPNMTGLFVRGWTGSYTLPEGQINYDTETDRTIGSIQMDAIPNIKGTWSMEITGGEDNFSGSVSIALDEDGNYKQVDGKSSAPSGSYDYLINFDASASSEKYTDVDEIRVKNIALIPAIKY